MGEPYRTLLGHFRHEIAHYYWDRLVTDTPAIEEFRQLFGDEREDYAAALQRLLCQRARRPIGRNASSPPMRARTRGRISPRPGRTISTWSTRWRPRPPSVCGCGRKVGADLSAVIDFDPHVAEMDRIIDAWLPLTFAVNSINRSMGQPDLYPFVLPPAVIWKLTFIHDRIHAGGSHRPRDSSNNALRAIVAGLKRPVGSPQIPD